ncbi:MAG: 2Fe-2S iron-sulfur cluster binding domain-containing protein [Planctomycetes bacterium]|nr:2Fe-2S iron-sulfur cluster binding domain-containing protein [Planctomycetota bacterium]
MGDRNPYIGDDEVQPPTQSYQIIFVDEARQEHALLVKPEEIPYGDHGLPGSLLDIALGHGIEVDHACGGVCACSTCHVIVRAGLKSCNEASEEEEDQLDEAYGLTGQSRLACRCVPNGRENLVVEVPVWNRNLAREEH